jgi:RNA polymerase sigma-70 factor (ECF subfamily)
MAEGSGTTLLSYYLSVLETEQERKRMSDIYEAFQLTCLYAARSVTQDKELAEDAVHNAFLNLIRQKGLLSLPDEDLRALLIAIVKRRTIDLLRKENREAVDSLDEVMNVVAMDDSAEIRIAKSEDFERLTQCIASLEERYRSILQLKYFSELSNSEIGNCLGLTNRQVETSLYRAKLKLRKIFCESEVKAGA